MHTSSFRKNYQRKKEASSNKIILPKQPTEMSAETPTTSASPAVAEPTPAAAQEAAAPNAAEPATAAPAVESAAPAADDAMETVERKRTRSRHQS